MTAQRGAPPTLTEVIEVVADDAAFAARPLPPLDESLPLDGAMPLPVVDASWLADQLLLRLQPRLESLLEARLKAALDASLARAAAEAAVLARADLQAGLRELVAQAVDEILPGPARR